MELGAVREEVLGTGPRAMEPRGRGAELFELGYPGSSPHPSPLSHSIAGLILITRQTTGQGAAGHKSENPGLGIRQSSQLQFGLLPLLAV